MSRSARPWTHTAGTAHRISHFIPLRRNCWKDSSSEDSNAIAHPAWPVFYALPEIGRDWGRIPRQRSESRFWSLRCIGRPRRGLLSRRWVEPQKGPVRPAALASRQKVRSNKRPQSQGRAHRGCAAGVLPWTLGRRRSDRSALPRRHPAHEMAWIALLELRL